MTDESQTEKTIKSIAEVIDQAEHILFITGAGISADSGLPTYRGVGGLYEDEFTAEGISIEMALSAYMFTRRPDITWKYLWQIGSACHGASFNRAHEIIALIQQRKPNSVVLTQNIDGLHRAAGTTNLIEVHGHAFDLYCTRCRANFSAADVIANYEVKPSLPPLCPRCDGMIRPDVVLFGEQLPDGAVSAMMGLAFQPIDLVIAIGTSSSFPYILKPLIDARYRGAPTVEINPADTHVSDIVTYRLKLRAAEAMEKIWRYFAEQ
ncbi:MAG: NAD-dependent protein deacylase [Anaerolineaceae bacterium]|nr:NAD-dependent protein deacylase [Anaerolineaceae bacterium]MCB9099722.1 NAD-dependent protein deacylase [Anaerolineales bacterium]